jgi:hypothetical protein
MYRLLELSVSTDHILSDMAHYADLGFGECQVNEIVQHHYGVLGDGRFHIGLHETEFDTPSLTYVLPDVARFAPALRHLKLKFERADLSDDQFNQISFFDPGGQRVNLIEARTFSPTPGDDSRPHLLGRYKHIELPYSAAREHFWNGLHSAIEPSTDDNAKKASPPMVHLHPNRQRLTVVYAGDLEALIVHSAQQGWQRFAVTADDQGVYKTPHDFDMLIQPAAG